MSEVDVNVDVVDDDLTAFEDDFFGKAKPEVTEEEKEDVTPVEETDAEDGEKVEDEVEDQEPEEEPEEQPKKNRKTAKERISELTAKNREKDEALRQLEARLAKLEAKPEEDKPAPKPVKADREPHPDDKGEDGELLYPLGEFDPKFNAALVRHTLKVEREAAEAEAAKKAEQTARETEAKKAEEAEERLVAEWDVKLNETEKELPDLRERLTDLQDAFGGLDDNFGLYLAKTIMAMDRGPEVLYYLAENISEAEAIASSSPVAATIALGRIEGRLTAKSDEGKKSKPTKAPEPPKTTKGNGTAKIVRGDTDDLDAFEREFYSKRRF